MRRPRRRRAGARRAVPGGPPAGGGTRRGDGRLRRRRHRAGRRRPAGLLLHLSSEDLFDPLRDIPSSAPTGPRGDQAAPASSSAEVLLDGLSGQRRDSRGAALGLMAQTCIEVVWQLHGRALHGMPAYQFLSRVDDDDPHLAASAVGGRSRRREVAAPLPWPALRRRSATEVASREGQRPAEGQVGVLVS